MIIEELMLLANRSVQCNYLIKTYYILVNFCSKESCITGLREE